MRIVRKRGQMRAVARALRAKGLSVGFVPTMGYLHEGHLSLVRRARAENEAVVVSIFVNPAQFGPGEDFDRYPRNHKRDMQMLKGLADYVFMPAVCEVYGKDEQITFEIKDIARCLCGISRPLHFQGVVLVLAKFLNIIRPDRLYVGQKDYQQTVVIRRLLDELFFDAEIVVCPTVREGDGLAMSSRNKYLAPAQRKASAVLRKSLSGAEKILREGEKDPKAVIRAVRNIVDVRGHDGIEYADIRDAGTLKPVRRIGKKPVVVALAVRFGETRLIDNILFKPGENA